MNIAVGSTNPVKITAVENIAKKLWPDATVVGIEVNHGTSIQPRTQQETISGALARATLAQKHANADYGFGLEGGTFETEHGMYLDSWIAIVDKHGAHSIASCGSMPLPEKIAKDIRNGKELGPAADTHFKTHNIKQKEGIIGVLTKNMVTRTQLFESGIVYALTKFMNPEHYT